MSVVEQKRPAPWRTPAVVIVAACLLVMLGFGIRSSFGLFLEPMSGDRGWGREVFAFSMAVQNLVWGLGQPFAGMVADRWGAGRVLAGGGVLYAVGVFLMAQASTPEALLISNGFFVGLALSAVSFGVALAGMARVVPPERRSWVLGLGTAAGSFGQFAMVPIGQGLIAAYGWSSALVMMAVMALAIVPLAGVLNGRAQATVGMAEQSIRAALAEAARHRGYICLTLGFFVCGYQVAFIGVHLPAYIGDLGLPVGVGAWALSLIGLFNIVGAYGAGLIGSRVSKKKALSLLYLLRSIVVTVFILTPPSAGSVLVFSAVMGLLWLSTVPLTSGIVAQVFGPRYMGTLFGIVFLSHQVGSFLGVWLGGRLYDATGSYDMVWWIGVGLGLAAAVIHLPIDERALARPAAASA